MEALNTETSLEDALPEKLPHKVERCMDWLQKQNSQVVKKSIQNKNDIQFIIQMNAERKKFLLSAAEDEATVPEGIDEPDAKPMTVSVRKLRVDNLRLECDWQNCKYVYSNYEDYTKHVSEHAKQVHVINKDDTVEYVCLWDTCGFKTVDNQEIVRHINYHSYHGKLLAVGFNGRATLKLLPCHKDSTKRNQLPLLKSYHYCMWIECDVRFNSMQHFLDHVRQHIQYAESNTCSWAGCGVTVNRKSQLVDHVRSHTGERMIACYHCGAHFANNRKLLDHLRRQNVNPNSPFACSICGNRFASKYLMDMHWRQHVSAFACALCDMTAQSRAALAQHVRYRHMPAESRTHACPHCEYKAVRKFDLDKHILTHTRKKRRRKSKNDNSTDDGSESEIEEKKPKVRKKYACHLCPEEDSKVFSRGTLLTKHFVKKHDAVWTFGYSRFRYQLCEDGIYRLTTTRCESYEVSTKINDGVRKEPLIESVDFTIKQTAEATAVTPKSFEIILTGNEEKTEEIVSKQEDPKVEILMCDVDEKGNIIKTQVINNVVVS